jgi:predicted nucleic-acid-binding Zn-ribbon protein
MQCPKCSGEMTEGFVLDRSYGNIANQKPIWVEGQPEESLLGGLKVKNKLTYLVQSFRCADCRYLEFYTTDRIYF